MIFNEKGIPISRPQAILFDWDNTLVDTFDAIHAAMNATLEAFDLPIWTLAEAKVRMQHSGRDAMPQIFGNRWLDAGRHFYACYDRDHLKHLAPLPGALDLINDLAAHGIKAAVVSNKRGDVVRREVAHLGLDSCFAAIIGSGDCAYDKPAADPALAALAILEQKPGPDVWFVGDAPVDWACATVTGCRAVAIGDLSDHKTGHFSGNFQDVLSGDCERIFLNVANCPELQKILHKT